ncbi:phosphodiesterase [Mesobaculum littorinae]|uniref:Phosphodiesterase n=1 Tax=Mesobaculum littorinae TaxID=2486419 RepID=A0A438AGN2_9RHOB|nr:glycerophosphodiester phosphodiesterase family protein [Mesobaculum littorinae]RVV97848.1 phosphodiesterase [Mesobaculum littorinae]
MTRPPSAPPLPAAFLSTPIAHRALHDRAAGRPENSRVAIAAAVAAGYGIEIDVQMSADGRAMVFHDDALDRLTEATGPLRARDADTLGAITLRDGAEGIPTLREVLSLVAGRVPLLIEVKDQDGALGPRTGDLERAVAGDLAGYAGPVAVMSFNPHAVRHLAQAAPDLPRGLTTCAFDQADWDLPADRCDALRRIAAYDEVGASFVSHQHGDLSAPRVAQLKSQGAAVLCWTIRSPTEETAARRVADNVTFEGYTPAPVPA